MILWLLVGCLGEPCVGTPMTQSEAGIEVTSDEHPDGWGRADCAACHAQDAIHRDGCSPGVDPVALQDEAATTPCTDCHGDNGVTP